MAWGLSCYSIPAGRIFLDRQKKWSALKVLKCEIFDRSDFPDFYTMKSLGEGDFGVNKKIFHKNI